MVKVTVIANPINQPKLEIEDPSVTSLWYFWGIVTSSQLVRSSLLIVVPSYSAALGSR